MAGLPALVLLEHTNAEQVTLFHGATENSRTLSRRHNLPESGIAMPKPEAIRDD